MDTTKIKDALAYVHYHESRERGEARLKRSLAVWYAIRVCALND